MDRWKLRITEQIVNKSPGKPVKTNVRTLAFQNYFSIGVDAACALDFHKSREYDPIGVLKFSRHVNKMWWGLMGAKEILASRCADIHSNITLELDNKLVKLPEDL